jgi:hypothetical protein
MSFIGDLDFKDGRNPSQTTTLVLQRCLETEGKNIETFLHGLSINPLAFFTDINADWLRRPFIGQHVFKVLQAAGYKGTENDIWYSVTGSTAPYAVKKPKAEPKKRTPRKPVRAH